MVFFKSQHNRIQRCIRIPLKVYLEHMLGPIPRVSDSLDLGWGPRICFFSKFPGDLMLLVSMLHLRSTDALKRTSTLEVRKYLF